MIETIVGKEGFKKGIAKYFELFDGQAITTEDFVAAMEQANDVDLTQFKNWYDQAGTPEITIETHYNQKAKTYQVVLKQFTPPTPESNEKKPFHIPFEMGLISASGQELELKPIKEKTKYTKVKNNGIILELTDAAHEVVFSDIESEPTPSFLREFSSPVKIKYNYSKPVSYTHLTLPTKA